MRQRWADLAYLHWPVHPTEIGRLLPDGLEVDTVDDAAWVGLVPFEMRDVRIGPLPPLPHLSSFSEVNVRTYVRDARGRPAVHFFSLDVPRLLPMAVARTAFGLPYCWARTRHAASGNRWRWDVERRLPRADGARSVIHVAVGERIPDGEVTPLEHFLTARWALTSRVAGRPVVARVDHPPWPLHRGRLLDLDDGLVAAAGLTVDGPPSVLCSPGVDVEIGPPRRVRGPTA